MLQPDTLLLLSCSDRYIFYRIPTHQLRNRQQGKAEGQLLVVVVYCAVIRHKSVNIIRINLSPLYSRFLALLSIQLRFATKILYVGDPDLIPVAEG